MNLNIPTYLILLLLLLPLKHFSQQVEEAIIYKENDYSALDKYLINGPTVLLGEQTHGDGATFDEKILLIKHLHESLGYNIIAFESGLYDNYKAFLLYKSQKGISIYNQSVIDLWSGQQFFEELLSYIEKRAEKGFNLRIMGFDNQEGLLFQNYFMTDLNDFFKEHDIAFEDSQREVIEKSFIYRDIEEAATNKTDSIALYKQLNYLRSSFEKIKNLTLHEKMLKQVVKSKIADIDFEIREIQNQKITIQNPRDAQMYKNLLFLQELYPDEKFICWGASYHFAQTLSSVAVDGTTTEYLKKQIKVEEQLLGHSESSLSDIDDLHKGVPMGQHLKERLGSKVFSIAFTSYEGTYKGYHNEIFPILTPPDGSLEAIMNKSKYNTVCVDTKKILNGKFYCSAIGNIPIKAEWSKIFDAIVFIKKSYPPSPRSYSISNNDAGEIVIRGNIVEENGKPISTYSDIYLLNSGKSAVANSEGEFIFNFTSPEKRNEKIVIAAFGYITDTISVSNLTSQEITITLKKDSGQNINLDEIVLQGSAKAISSEEIIHRARKNIEDNYFQQSYNQKFFYRTRVKRNKEIYFNEEAFLLTYNERGLKGLNNPSGNFFGTIKKFRNTTNNFNADKWSGIGNFWTILERNLILSKANILYRTKAYDCLPPEIIRYNNKDVYKITFINNSPGVYSTGYGYPAPVSSNGTIYIDTESYTVYRYEHCVVRKERENKRIPGKKYQSTHNIVETYKEVNGKYFVNFSNELTREKVISKTNNEVIAVNFYINTLMSQDIKTDNITKITRPIDNIKIKTVLTEDTEYWRNVNIYVEDKKVENLDCD